MRRVIVVDDEPITRMDICEILKEGGYDVVGQAADGFDAIEQCKKLKPDFVIMDVKMPILDGLKASKIIIKDKLARGAVLLTAYSSQEFIEEAKNVGVSGYIVKPIDEKSFLPNLEVILSKQEEYEELEKKYLKTNQKLEDRKRLDIAKSILMERDKMTEKEAYTYIRSLSMDKRCDMGKIIDIIILSGKTMLRTICKQQTTLSDKSIRKLEKIAEGLTVLSKLLKADIFIDCPTGINDAAIVVAEANPETGSSYTQSVVGQYAYRKNEPAVLRTLETGLPSRDYKALTQENTLVRQNVVPIKNEKEEVIGVLIVEEGSSDTGLNKELNFLHDATNELLRSSMEMTKEQKIIDYINDGIIIFNEKGILIYANSKAKNIYKKIGYKHNILGAKFSNIVLNNIAFKDVLEGIIPGSVDIHIAKMDLNIHYYLIKESKNVKNIVLFIKDLTEIKEKEKELILKSVAIKEIHHRVKNNLQTIASLLRIQARKTEDEAVRQAFNESINRILSIAVTHEILAQNGLDDLKIKEMFSKILKNSIRASIGENLDLKTSISGDDFKINSDKSTSIALIANELVQNSITHGFKGMTSGKIDITVKQGKIKSKVTIADNGVGFKSKDFKNESLGLQIVKSLVKEKLFGTIDIKSTRKGTIIIFDFEN